MPLSTSYLNVHYRLILNVITNMVNELIFSGLLLPAAFSWLNAQRIKELALQATKAYCFNAEVQLLDKYVALNKLWLIRDKAGKLKIQRRYQFEFS